MMNGMYLECIHRGGGGRMVGSSHLKGCWEAQSNKGITQDRPDSARLTPRSLREVTTLPGPRFLKIRISAPTLQGSQSTGSEEWKGVSIVSGRSRHGGVGAIIPRPRLHPGQNASDIRVQSGTLNALWEELM